MDPDVNAEQLALVQGMDHTKATLRAWRRAPGQVLRPWLGGSLAVALGLLLATWLIATQSVPQPGIAFFPGVTRPADGGDYLYLLCANGLVLLLHALACVAGFMAGSSLPAVADTKSGLWRRVHEVAGPLAIAFVGCATLFSLTTQAWILGGGAADLAASLDLSPAALLGIVALHAVPELTALFLPLAAWTIASRKGAWEDLLAATAATVCIAVPVLLVSCAVETWITPGLLLAAAR